MFFLCFICVEGLGPRVLRGTAWASWLRLCLDMPSCGCLWLPVAARGLLGPAVAGCGRLQLAGLAASGCGWQWLAVAGSVGLWLHGLLLWL